MIDINIKFGDGEEYAYINATSIDKLNELIMFLNKSFNIEDKPQAEPKAKLMIYKSIDVIVVSSVRFPNGEIGSFWVPSGDFRKILNQKQALEFSKKTNDGAHLPTRDELNFILKYKDLIDSVDPSDKGKFSDIDISWIWSSTDEGENSTTGWVQRPDGHHNKFDKKNSYWVVPFKRIVT